APGEWQTNEVGALHVLLFSGKLVGQYAGGRGFFLADLTAEGDRAEGVWREMSATEGGITSGRITLRVPSGGKTLLCDFVDAKGTSRRSIAASRAPTP
ncbi:MAG: hypothetical protein QHJ73_13890, partial [Armatimonadota bacterium]|nr:hypothetical protein [Armatimonadota bacterium]